MTSNGLKRPQLTSKDPSVLPQETKNKNIARAGSMHEIGEVNDKYLDETLQNKNL